MLGGFVGRECQFGASIAVSLQLTDPQLSRLLLLLDFGAQSIEHGRDLVGFGKERRGPRSVSSSLHRALIALGVALRSRRASELTQKKLSTLD